MRPSVNPDIVRAKAQPARNDTAYLIFDKGASLLYSTNFSHIRMKNGMADDPIYAETESSYVQATKSLMDLYGPIIDMVDYFMEGATIQIKNTLDVVTIYERIENHLDAHIQAMVRIKLYSTNDSFETFSHLTEFALSLYPRVRQYRLDNKVELDGPSVKRLVSARPTFMSMKGKDTHLEERGSEPKQEKQEIPSVITKYNSLERIYNQGR